MEPCSRSDAIELSIAPSSASSLTSACELEWSTLQQGIGFNDYKSLHVGSQDLPGSTHHRQQLHHYTLAPQPTSD